MATHRRFGINIPMVHLPSFVPEAQAGKRDGASDPYFLYAGRLERTKAPHTLIEPFRRWGKARLVIAGAGRDEPRLRRLAAGSDRIELRGNVPDADLRRLYRDAVALVVPSLTFEIAPLVILEAFREGTPVIARNLGALPEAISDSGGGLVYDDDASLMAALDRLLGDARFRDELGRRAQEGYRALWSPERHVRRYLDIIGEMQGRRAAGMRPA
jgi:glycosyltransferase involved in cell wall biosynthesis